MKISRRLLFLQFFLSFALPAFSQVRYDQDHLTAEFHQSRRQALRNLMPPNSIAVFFSNPVQNRSNDVDFEFHQDPDFYYLSGLTEPNSLLLILKEKRLVNGMESDEFIFVQDRDPARELWTGRRFGSEGVKKELGFNAVFLNTDFENFGIDFRGFDKILSLRTDQYLVPANPEKGTLFYLYRQFDTRTKRCRKGIDNSLLRELMASLRAVKTEEELALLGKAIDITGSAHLQVMKSLKPGMAEYEVEALLEYVFKKNGAEDAGFPSIVGGGENSCILHYTTNRRKLKDGDLLVIDIGAEYRGYSADITRTLPVNGRFSKEQAIIYQVVLEAQRAGIADCKPGNAFLQPGITASNIIKKRLLELGIIEREQDYRRYFMHGTSHYLGLDVHDAGNYQLLAPGNVITVEPGIYIPAGSPCDPKWWNIGVRIEDDILITGNGYEILSGKAPADIQEIEKIMKKDGIMELPD